MKPIIGIISRFVLSEEENKMYGMYDDILRVIYNNGGIPICIYPDKSNLKDTLSLCNGLIFQGGDMILDNERDYLEYAYINNIPTLGICLGMQIMGIMFDSSFYDVLNHKFKDVKYVHNVLIDKKSLLYSILNKDIISVNSRHKSAITRPNINASAVSNDGVIEAIEDNSKCFFVGLQWHPESLNDDNSKKIFEYFIKVCKRSK